MARELPAGELIALLVAEMEAARTAVNIGSVR